MTNAYSTVTWLITRLLTCFGPSDALDFYTGINQPRKSITTDDFFLWFIGSFIIFWAAGCQNFKSTFPFAIVLRFFDTCILHNLNHKELNALLHLFLTLALLYYGSRKNQPFFLRLSFHFITSDKINQEYLFSSFCFFFIVIVIVAIVVVDTALLWNRQ